MLNRKEREERNRFQCVVRGVFASLLDAYGPQHWWPADGPFEVMVGAVLTQNTAWTNVERALARLKACGSLAAGCLLSLPTDVLTDALRPAGYFNVKARRLRAFCEYYQSVGGLAAMRATETPRLREALLAVKGIGPETADDMLLYALDRPVFVVDAYTRRIFTRLGLLDGNEGYESIRAAFEQALSPDVNLYKEYHALIVHHGKHICKTRPRCAECALRDSCHAMSALAAGARAAGREC